MLQATQTQTVNYQREREVSLALPSFQKVGGSNVGSRMTCVQILDYYMEGIRSTTTDLLDLVLDGGNLDITFSNRINGLECEIHDWMTVSLIQTMQYCGFKLKNMCHSQTDRECQSLIFYVPKAFITTPLSYLLERSVPQGRLKRLHIYLDWETKKLQPLRSLMEYPNEELIQYVDNGFSIILCQRMSQMYPLIFSKLYVQRLATSTKYIPTMARSLQRIADIAKTKSATDFYADTREMIDAIASRTRMLKPEEDPANPDFFSNTVIGLYCATKNMSTLRQCAKRPKPPALHTSTPSSPPDAHDTVANLWSAFRCDVEPIPELSNSQADASEDEELNIDDPFIHDL